MTNQIVGRELVSCPFCILDMLTKSLARHCKKVHGITDFRIKRNNAIPVCQKCNGLDSMTCIQCAGSGCQLQIEKRLVLCPVCKGSCHKDLLRAHLIVQHEDCLRKAELTQMSRPRLPAKASENLSARSLQKAPALWEPNAVLKKKLEERKLSVRKLLMPETPIELVKVTRCCTCGISIAEHLLGEHVKQIHEWKPQRTQVQTVRRPSPAKNPSPPLLKGSLVEIVITQSKPRQSICARCCGDGGVRGGCRECEGTGWVPSEMERDAPYNSAHEVQDSSRVSNADYRGNNAGGHFRDRDGRIGSTPMYDDYSDEA